MACPAHSPVPRGAPCLAGRCQHLRATCLSAARRKAPSPAQGNFAGSPSTRGHGGWKQEPWDWGLTPTASPLPSPSALAAPRATGVPPWLPSWHAGSSFRLQERNKEGGQAEQDSWVLSLRAMPWTRARLPPLHSLGSWKATCHGLIVDSAAVSPSGRRCCELGPFQGVWGSSPAPPGSQPCPQTAWQKAPQTHAWQPLEIKAPACTALYKPPPA